MSKVIAIDVDLTIVDTGKSWLDWLNRCSGKSLSLSDCKYDYNLGKFFPELDDPFDYWRSETLYDYLSPYSDAKEVINRLSKDNDIVFVSTIKGNHHKSKYNFLKRNFPLMKGFIATKEKNFVRCDVMIDDRNSVLNSMNNDVVCWKYITPYTQDQELKKPVSCYSSSSWCRIEEFLK